MIRSLPWIGTMLYRWRRTRCHHLNPGDSRRCRLAVEMLEDRVLPSLTLFVTQADHYDVAGQTVSVGLYCWSVPGDSVTFSAHGLPPGLSIDSSNGTISGTINYGAEASSPFAATVTATDATAGVCDSAQFLFFIAAPE